MPVSVMSQKPNVLKEKYPGTLHPALDTNWTVFVHFVVVLKETQLYTPSQDWKKWSWNYWPYHKLLEQITELISLQLFLEIPKSFLGILKIWTSQTIPYQTSISSSIWSNHPSKPLQQILQFYLLLQFVCSASSQMSPNPHFPAKPYWHNSHRCIQRSL